MADENQEEGLSIPRRVSNEWLYRGFIGVFSLLTYLTLFWMKGSFVSQEKYEHDRIAAEERFNKQRRDDMETYARDREAFKSAINDTIAQWRAAFETSQQNNLSESRQIREAIEKINLSLARDADMRNQLGDHENRIRKNTDDITDLRARINKDARP